MLEEYCNNNFTFDETLIIRKNSSRLVSLFLTHLRRIEYNVYDSTLIFAWHSSNIKDKFGLLYAISFLSFLTVFTFLYVILIFVTENNQEPTTIEYWTNKQLWRSNNIAVFLLLIFRSRHICSKFHLSSFFISF